MFFVCIRLPSRYFYSKGNNQIYALSKLKSLTSAQILLNYMPYVYNFDSLIVAHSIISISLLANQSNSNILVFSCSVSFV